MTPTYTAGFAYAEIMRPLVIFCFVFSLALAQTPPQWVARSNQNTQILIDLESKYAPEDAGQYGVLGLDDQITVLTADRPAKMRADLVKAREQLQTNLKAEKDPLVRQDLEILIQAADRDIRNHDAVEKTFLPYENVGLTIYDGVKSLLDDVVQRAGR